jgi:hypothetical protein
MFGIFITLSQIASIGGKMGHKSRVHELFGLMSNEVLAFIKESESGFPEGWVPATYIKDQLKLNKPSYPQGNPIDNKTGWLFSTIARHLQDENLVEFKKTGSRSFYRCRG